MNMNEDDDVLSFLGEGDGEEVEDVMTGIEEAQSEQVTTMPSMNEIRLGRKVLDLEKERDALAAELERMKARYPDHHPTIPVPTVSASPVAPITIPHDLLPTLNLLRHHVSELTRDNEALRYTFLGEASSSKVTLDTPIIPQGIADIERYGTARVELKAVVKRVREVMRENEELGEMILEAGRGNGAEWQKAIDDSKLVIESLESDLAHHLTVVQSVRAELVAYKTHFGPIPKGSTVPSAILSPPTPQNLSLVTAVPKLSRAGSVSASTGTLRHERPRDSDRHRHKERDRDRDKDKGKERSGPVKSGERRDDRNKDGSNGIHRHIGGVTPTDPGRSDNGGSRGSDRDRDYKRRR